jgi:hypothetical protein
MQIKKIFLPLLLVSIISVSSTANAGLVWFSRANCINNESITWDWPSNNYWLYTQSLHFINGAWEPTINTGWQYTYRSAAVHWGEGVKGGAYVVGKHYQFINGRVQLIAQTNAQGCNLTSFFPYW